MEFSHLMQIKPSATVAINSLALKKQAAGERVYNLSAGEPMMPTPTVIIAAAIQAMHEGKTHYPPVAGVPELRQAAVGWMNETCQTNYSSQNCLVTCGGKFALYALFQAMLNPGDEVLIIAPYWVSYPSMVSLFGGVSKIVATTEEQGWKMTTEALEKAVSPRTKILSINNASNPTGVLYTRAELKEILDWARQHQLLIVSDEVYSGLVYDAEEFVSCGSFSGYQDSVVVVQSCSKHFAMTGWRVGFLFGPEEIVQKLTVLQGQSTTGTASISQWAACAAMQQAQELMLPIRLAMQERRDAFVKIFSELFHPVAVPASALYLFVSLSLLGVTETNSVAFCERVLSEANIALVPGNAFGQEGYVRFSFGDTIENLEAGVQALKNFLKNS